MNKNLKIRYISISIILLSIYVPFLLYETVILFFKATQLSIFAKIWVSSLLWGFLFYGIYIFIKYYKRIDTFNINLSNNLQTKKILTQKQHNIIRVILLLYNLLIITIGIYFMYQWINTPWLSRITSVIFLILVFNAPSWFTLFESYKKYKTKHEFSSYK